MVGVLVRLRLTLLRNQAEGGTEKVVLLVLGVLFAALVAAGAAVALVGLRFTGLDLAGAVVTVFGSLAVVAWAALPVLTSADDVMNDPVRFALLPLAPRTLAAGLLVASSVGPFAVGTLLATTALAVTFARGPLPVVSVLVGLVAAVLATATCLLGSRAALTSVASVLAGRRGREVSVGVGVLVMSLLGLSGPALAGLGERLQTGAVDAAVQVLAWTPLGAVWAMPWAAAEGRWAVLGGRTLVAVATLAGLWWLYVRALRSRLRPTGGRGRARATSRRTAAAPPSRSLLPDTPRGALLQRCLRYWVRDSRYVVSVIALPVVVGLLVLLPVLTDASTGVSLAAGPALALLLSFTMLNELAYDGSALWTTLASAARGRDDRSARVLALLAWGLPATLVVAVLGPVVAGRPELAPATVGLSVGILLVGNGVAAVSSVALPFPVPPPGANPFAGNPGSSTAALVQQGLAVLALVPLLAPLLGLAVWAWFVPAVGWALVVVGAGYGTAVLAVGVRVGGDLMDRRGPELLARLSR
ncbi:hypothetical protein [Jannaschia sp. R86511]|uniref:hypothetical protein n=1 Tax=Jannaschia sp. R86511 TaxID=3093853 RepID=UPI0036D2EFCA